MSEGNCEVVQRPAFRGLLVSCPVVPKQLYGINGCFDQNQYLRLFAPTSHSCIGRARPQLPPACPVPSLGSKVGLLAGSWEQGRREEEDSTVRLVAAVPHSSAWPPKPLSVCWWLSGVEKDVLVRRAL